MSNRELAKTLIDQIPESRLFDETPNAETLEAMAELDSGGGHRVTGSTEVLFAELMED